MVKLSLFRSKDEKINSMLDDAGGDIIDIGNQTGYSLAKKAALFIAGVVFVIIIWYLVSWFYNEYMARSILFPDPVSAFEKLYDFFDQNIRVFGTPMIEHLEASLRRWLIGFSLAFAIGIAIGLVLSSNNKVYEFGIVPVNIIQMIPGLAWLPVTILLLGFGEESAIFIIAITVISPIAINVANGIRKVPKVNMRVASMSERTRFEKFTEVLLPFASLDILMGLRIGMANGWRMLIAAEMVVGVAVGLGFVIQTTTGYADYISAFACIVLICIIGLVIDKVVLAGLEGYTRRKLGMEDE